MCVVQQKIYITQACALAKTPRQPATTNAQTTDTPTILTDWHALLHIGHVMFLLEVRRMVVNIANCNIDIALRTVQPIVGLYDFWRVGAVVGDE